MEELLKREDLHGYQNYSVEFIKSHPVAALLLSCGLGKTVTTLTAVNDLMYEKFEIYKVLVVCPLRVGAVWKDEVRHWQHLHNLTVSVAIGSAKERRQALMREADIYIINRENISWLIDESGIEFDFDTVVLDELSSFKNHQSKRVRSFMKVRPKVKRVIGLTGTPSSNGLMDLFSEFKCLDMGERLGRFIGWYRTRYFRPDRMNGHVVYSYKLLPGAEDEIYRRISDITISMKATEFLNMPELVNSAYRVDMSEDERARYEDLKRDYIIQLPESEVTAANAAALSGKLSQLANGAVYTDDGEIRCIHNRKLDALEDIIEAANGNPVLVAYWFKHDLKRICERLDHLGLHYELIAAQGNIDRWNDGKVPVGLIHPAAAGHGLNLQKGGNTLVWFGLTWSLELYQQTVARLWRQGQRSGTVIVQHIITRDTVDERIMRALQQKDNIQEALIDAVRAEVMVA